MSKQFIERRTAELAKEKGFDQHQYRAADKGYMAHYPIYTNGTGEQLRSPLFNLESIIAVAPTQSDMQKYIRENRGIHIEVHRNASGYYWSMCKSDSGTDLGWTDSSGPNLGGAWNEYEDALEHAIETQWSYELPKDTDILKHWGNYVQYALKYNQKRKKKK